MKMSQSCFLELEKKNGKSFVRQHEAILLLMRLTKEDLA